MKLNEILDLEGPHPQRKTSLMDVKRRLSHGGEKHPSKVKFLGSGSYADVYHVPTRTNTVVKVGKISGTTPATDPYLNYVKAVIQHGKNNPYLPQIFDVKIGQDSNGIFMFKVKLEKLSNIYSVNVAEWEHIFMRILQASSKQEMMSRLESLVEDPHDLRPADKGNWVYLFVNIISRDLARSGTFPGFLEPEFRNALSLIYHVSRSVESFIDMSASNVLMRRTTHGVQPVYVDPLA